MFRRPLRTATILLTALLLASCEDGDVPMPEFLLPDKAESANDELRLMRYEDIPGLVIADTTAEKVTDFMGYSYGERIYRDEARQLMAEYDRTGNEKLQTPTQKVTPLHLACHFGRERLVKQLLTEGADANARAMLNGQECTPLMLALLPDGYYGSVKSGDGGMDLRLRLVDILLDAGAGFGGLEGMVMACAIYPEAEANALVDHLHQRGLQVPVAQQPRLLRACVKGGNEELLLKLLKRGYAPSADDKRDAERLLALVAEENWTRAATHMLEQRLVAFSPEWGCALHEADSDELFELLLAHGASSESLNDEGMTPLACISRRLKKAESSLESYGDDPDFAEENAEKRAQVERCKSHIRRLLRQGADPTRRGLDKESGLLGACALQKWSPAFRAELRAESLLAEEPFTDPLPVQTRN